MLLTDCEQKNLPDRHFLGQEALVPDRALRHEELHAAAIDSLRRDEFLLGLTGIKLCA